MFPDLGLEKTPQEHVDRIVQIMAEVHRVLRDDGVVWLNYGDCYYNHRPGKGSGLSPQTIANNDRQQPTEYTARRAIKQDIGSGNLMLMPYRIAIALQDWGWIVRNDVVWFKRNPMPEFVRGWSFDANTGELRKGSFRHTRAHEYIFQLVKSMQYWSNQEAVREMQSTPLNTKASQTFGAKGGKAEHVYGSKVSGDKWRPSGGRNPRSVMDVPTAPYKGAHYATFPPNLIAPLIRATCPRWACPVCGQGWSPVVEIHDRPNREKQAKRENMVGVIPGRDGVNRMNSQNMETMSKTVKEYRPTCSHEHTKDEAVPGIVLDPFVGSGTTVMVAKQLIRRGIGLDISLEYLDEQAKIRTGSGTPSKALDDLPLFNQ